MSPSESPAQPVLKIEGITRHFDALLAQAGTSRERPALAATWSAFAAFCREAVDCDQDRLFFEAEISALEPDTFYVHFVRTCYGRKPKGHEWSHEVICDFLFPLDETLEELNFTTETEELRMGDSPEISAKDGQARTEFVREVRSQTTLWEALAQREPSKAEIYIGES